MCDAIREEVGLPASAGIGGTKIIAKIASGRAKPAGVLLVPKGKEREFLRPLPVRKFPGIGPKAEARMLAGGIHTLGELVDASDTVVRGQLAADAAVVEREMRGEGCASLGRERPAFHEHDPSGDVGSISNERTFFSALEGEAGVRAELLALTERVCWRARKRQVLAQTVAIKLRTTDFHTITRSLSGSPSANEEVIRDRVFELYQRARKTSLPVRLVGVALSNFVHDAGQLALPFTRHHRIGRALVAVRVAHGYDAVRLGATRKTSR